METPSVPPEADHLIVGRGMHEEETPSASRCSVPPLEAQGRRGEDPSDPPLADHLPAGRGEGQEAPSVTTCGRATSPAGAGKER